MAKTPFNDYRDELAAQQKTWARKGSIRNLYARWYARIVAHLSPARPAVEIGAGVGNFKAFFPETVATDAIKGGDWIDQTVDARKLPYEPGSVGNFVLIDCLHHLPRPLNFLRAAARALKPGGRIVILDPAGTPWARLILGLFHHEPIDLTQDVFAEDGQPEPKNEGFTFTNQGLATLLFVRGLPETLKRVPELALVSVEHSDFLVWPATGGFSYFGLLPAFLVPPLHAVERVLTWPFASWLTGMRLLVVLERKAA
ncbi:MAG: class I SAM-dependent methyltransferase [Planctomycetes bacterium]|nr:class I SAM-dependent methyltransferase [Planctomycetota bacterium]